MRARILPSESVQASGTSFGTTLGADSQDSKVQQAVTICMLSEHMLCADLAGDGMRARILPSESVQASGTSFGTTLGADSQDSKVQQAAAAAAATTTDVNAASGERAEGVEGLIRGRLQ